MLDTLKQREREIFGLAFHLFETLTGLQSAQWNESDRSDVLDVIFYVVYTGRGAVFFFTVTKCILTISSLLLSN